MKTKVKSLAKRLLVASGAVRAASRLKKQAVAVLRYHSIMPRPETHLATLGQIIHSTDLFREHMKAVRRHYNPVSLDDVVLFVNGDKQLPARPVVITFDDGYADNTEFAAPILEEFGVQGVFYITVDCIDKNTPPWVAKLRHAFHTTIRPRWSLDDSRWNFNNPADRAEAFRVVCEHCARLTGAEQETFVTRIEDEFKTTALPDAKELMMTWSQARQLVQRGHIVGSHTMTHPNLAHVAEKTNLRFELEQSKRRLEEELGSPATHFSYPHPILKPHWSEQTVQICRELGYRTAVTTDYGPVYEGDDPLTLRRVPAGDDITELRWTLDCTFMGRTI